MMIMMYGISLFLVLIILGPPPSSLVVSSFSILYSFPNSSLWRDRYYDPTTQNPSKTKTRGGNNNNKQTRDYYQVLGVGKTAKNPEIKAAFHRLVKLYHPDANPSSSQEDTTTTTTTTPTMRMEKFLDIKQAYKVLIDPRQRNKYDGQRYTQGYAADTPNFVIDAFEDMSRSAPSPPPPVERYQPLVQLAPNDNFMKGSLFE